jgi:ribosomal protein S18 acetylase RimI-like enzyme
MPQAKSPLAFSRVRRKREFVRTDQLRPIRIRAVRLFSVSTVLACLPTPSLAGIRSYHRGAFADHRGEGEETYEDFRHLLLDRPEFDPELWSLAWYGEELAGYLGAQEDAAEDPTRGYVALLGVRRTYRRRGIGEALLRHAFQALFRRGKRGCDLHVDADSLTGATGLYERVGITAHPRFALWEKELRPAARP